MILSMKRVSVFSGLLFAVAAAVLAAVNVVAQANPGSDFGLQVTPSPLVVTLTPGVEKKIELKIRNTGTGTERLVIQPREFDVDKKTGAVKLLDTSPEEISKWITFSSPTFTIKPGEVFTQNISINLPKDTGFSYSFTMLISRANAGASVDSGASLRGSIAVFTLINVDRPGATRKFEITDFKTSQPVYEYLPASFDISFMNTGNTIVQPVGNVFIMRNNGDRDHISVLPVNPAKGYLLPDRPRTLTTQWTEGFPVYKNSQDNTSGEVKEELTWDWSKITDFRIGLYTAKVIAVYHDGQRDIPIERTVQFWVIPWRMILIFLAVISVFVVGAWVILRKSGKLLHVKKKKSKTDSES